MMNSILRQVSENNAVSHPIVIHITDSEVCIGRKFKISLEKFPQISRHHSTIFVTDNNCLYIKDEGSLNGTFVNNEKIAVKKLKTLSVGDRIGFGIPCDQPNNGLVCVVCCDDPPYQVKDEVIVISDNDDEVHDNNCLEEVSVKSSDDDVKSVNSNDNVNNCKIVKCTSRANASFSSSGSSRIATVGKLPEFSVFKPTTSNHAINSITPSSFPARDSSSRRKNEKLFPSNATAETNHAINSIPQSSFPDRDSSSRKNEKLFPSNTTAETNTTRNTVTQSSFPDRDSSSRKNEKLFPSNTTAETNTTKNTITQSSFPDRDSSSRKNEKLFPSNTTAETNTTRNTITQSSFPDRDISSRKNEKLFPSNTMAETNTTKNTINSSSKNSYENKPCSSRTDRKLHSNNNVADSFMTKKLKTVVTTHLASLSADASINWHPPDSTKEISSRTRKTSFCHENFVEIGAPKTVNSRNVSNLCVNVKDASIQTAETNTVIHKTATFCNKLIEATKSVKTASFSNVPYSKEPYTSSKHNPKRKSSIENLPRKECTVYLVKCDSETFHFPPDVKNPFLKKHNHLSKASVDKHVRQNYQSSKSDAHKTNKDINVTLNSRNELFHSIKDQESKTTKQPNIEKRKFSLDDRVLDTCPSKKVCLTSKKDEKEFSVRHTKKHYNVGSESDSDNNEITNYSQVEEVIDISDDEIYLDFQSSQNFVYIKKEPGEIEDEQKDEIYAEIFERDSECLNLEDKGSKEKVDTEVESIETIRAFVGCSDEKEQRDFENNLADGNDYVENSFFPVISQDLESEEKNINNSPKKVPASPEALEVYYFEEQIKNKKDKKLSKIKLTDPKPLPCQQEHRKRQDKKDNLNNKSKSSSKKVPIGSDSQNSSSEEEIYDKEKLKNRKDKELSINQKEEKSSKIKLIEPKPLLYRPRYKKGRDEDFVEKSKPIPIPKFDKKTPKKLKKLSPFKVNRITQSNLKNFKIPRKRALPQNDNACMSSKQPEIEPYTNDSAFNNFPGSSKKSLSVKRRPEKFASRMGFLVNEIEINPRKSSKPVSKVPGIVRQGSSLHGKQNYSTTNIHNSSPCHQSSASVVTPSSASVVTPSSASVVTPSSASVVTPSSASVVTPSSASIVTPTSASVMTPRPASVITPRPASVITPRLASVITPRLASVVTQSSASAIFQTSASISVQNSAMSINALKKPIDSLQISNKDDFIKPRDPRQNRVARSSRQPEPNVPSTSKISDEINFGNKSANSSIQPAGNLRNNYPNNLMMNSLRFSVIKNLLKLQTGWLQEQKNKTVPPPSVYEGADYLQLRYKSYEAYVSSFCPMLMLELWEQMYIDSKEIIDSRKQYKKFYFSILSYTARDDCIELKCESVVNDKVSFCPREGNIVILELKENAHRCSPAFGYIFHHKVQSLDLKNLKHLQWKKLPKESGWLTDAKHWTFLAYVKKRDKPFALDDLMKGNGLSYIGNKLRLLDAMSYIKNSPLLDDFLSPKWNTFLVNYAKGSPSREYNTCQSEVINGVSVEINKSSEISKIILLQGPPGTGKTHTIIGLLQRLIHDNKFSQNFKVLVAAPSNAAIDEIGCRLIEVKKFSPRIKFVRIGSFDQVNPKMKPYFIDKKARNLFESDSNSAYNQKKDELEMLRMQITKLQKEPYSMHRYERIQHLENRYKLCYDSASSKKMDYHIEMDYKVRILKESHIILSTLSSCGLTILLKTFNPNSGIHFSCCIVDECTQCTELEILQPLALGINKLILVGDHKQLPATVTSKLACKYGFERSAFERFHLFFEKFCKKTPMYTLSEQFRMHSAICEFPSKYIYDKKIVTHPNTDLKYKDFPFHPYFVLDILVSQESDDSSSKINCTEASVIVQICSILIDIVDSSSIGIITPYQAQRSLYLGALNVNPHYKDIEVNTVDGFQGREKDIIILSSVRANSQSGSIGFLACKRRLNVAITRARKCLIICAHADSLMNNMDWRELIFDAKRRNVCVGVPSPKDIPLIFKYNLKKNR